MTKNAQFAIRALCAIAVTAAACAAPATAADWRYFDTQRPQPIDTWNFALGADDALWTFATGGARRTDAAGVTSAPVGLPPGSSVPEFDDGLPLADGGAILVDYDIDCRITRVDRTLRRLWRQAIPGQCADVAATPDGRVWLADSENTYLVGSGGVIEKVIAHGGELPPHDVQLAIAPDGGAAFAAAASERGGSELRRYRPDGTLRWSSSHPSLRIEEIVVAADDSTFAIGIVPAPGYRVGDVQAMRFDAHGTRQWTYVSSGRLDNFVEAALAADGALQILSDQHRPDGDALRTLHRLRTGGALAWSRDVCADDLPFDVPRFAMQPNGDTTLVCPQSDGARFLRIDSAGTTQLDAPLPVSAVRPLRLRRDGTIQVRGWRTDNPQRGRLFAVDTTGRIVDTPATAPIATEARALIDQQLAPDGTSYLLTQPLFSNGTESVVSKIDANGAFVWRQSLPSPHGFARLSAAGSRVCATTLYYSDAGAAASVVCLSTANGTVLWQRDVPRKSAAAAPPKTSPPAFYALHAAVLDDGTVTLLQSSEAEHEFVRFDADGAIVVDVTKPGLAKSASLDTAGRATLSLGVGDGSPQLVQYDRQGQQRRIGDAPNPLGVIDVVAGSAAADGSVLAIARTLPAAPNAAAELWSIGADGSVAWRYPYRTSARRSEIVRAAAAIYLVEDQFAPATGTPDTTRITRLAPQTGAMLWRAESTDPATVFAGGRFALSANGTVGVLVHGTRERLRVQRYSTQDGTRLDTSYVACSDYCGQAQALALDADGGARVALEVVDRARGRTAAVFALPAVGTPRAAIRVDQIGITGAWWAPYANGEGLVLDYLPASRTLFMPWFTFSRDGGNDTSGQRWYVIQGAAPAGATSVQLPITDTTGGNFDDGPVVTPRIVGTATLSFSDCSNGTLSYAFNAGENGGAAGTITLSRLSPATEACVLADGTTQPGAGARPAAQGFDARMSGSWFEPTTAGQGLQIVVQPGGIFFAPWFTYDPTGPSDDPGRQRWYTLQGTLAGARDGTVEAPIVQTVGGAFDSVPTDNMAIVGMSTLTFSGCDRARLAYRFHDSDAAGSLRGRSGSIDLVKIGGCTAP